MWSSSWFRVFQSLGFSSYWIHVISPAMTFVKPLTTLAFSVQIGHCSWTNIISCSWNVYSWTNIICCSWNLYSGNDEIYWFSEMLTIYISINYNFFFYWKDIFHAISKFVALLSTITVSCPMLAAGGRGDSWLNVNIIALFIDSS